jgi:hypothetical protein
VTQSQCRKYLARLHYKKLKKAAITTQCAWRGRVARKELRNLKMVSFPYFSCFSIGSYGAWFGQQLRMEAVFSSLLFHQILCYEKTITWFSPVSVLCPALLGRLHATVSFF